jgi:F0F1-type ATP synthase membrane subunit a
MLFSPLEQFEIIPLVPLRFGSLDLSFTNSSFLILLSVLAFTMLVLTTAGPGNGLLVPSRWQSIVEGIYTTVLDLINNTLGAKNGNS